MPTPSRAFAAVAETLAGVDPQDKDAVSWFYRRQFVDYPLPIRALIADFLVGLTGLPSAAALDALKHAVALPVEDIAPMEAPSWDEPHCTAMDDLATADKQVAVGG
jgi:hypothetical protein